MLPVALSLIGAKVDIDSTLFMGLVWSPRPGLSGLAHSPGGAGIFPREETFILAVFTTVLFSVVAHGVTALPLSEIYARKIKSNE